MEPKSPALGGGFLTTRKVPSSFSKRLLGAEDCARHWDVISEQQRPVPALTDLRVCRVGWVTNKIVSAGGGSKKVKEGK